MKEEESNLKKKLSKRNVKSRKSHKGEDKEYKQFKDKHESSTGSIDNNSKYGDPNWYFLDKELAEQASRFSFHSFIGDGTLVSRAALPSICVFAVNPSLGADCRYTNNGEETTTPETSAANLCARKLYASLSTKSGRTQSYAPQDVLTLLLAMGEVLSLASHLTRILGLAFTYSWRNRDFPKMIIQSLGVNADDFFANLSTYRVYFNTVLNIANKIPFPNNITWFKKCAALYSNVFKDSPDEMAQIYAFMPGWSWMVDETYEGGTRLETKDITVSLIQAKYTKTFGEYVNILKEMVDKLLTSSTYNVIYGDILNYVSNQPGVELLKLFIVDENYSVTPEYNPEILLHIHNAQIFVPRFPTNSVKDETDNSATRFNDVIPDPNTNSLIYAPLFATPGYQNAMADVVLDLASNMTLVDFPYGNPDLTERIEATRFSMRFKNVEQLAVGETDFDNYLVPGALSDHYIMSAFLYVGGVLSSGSSVFSTMRVGNGITNGTSAITAALYDKFRYFPFLYGNQVGITSNTFNHVLGEVNYFTNLDYKWLNRLNSLCLQGLFELR